MVTNYSEFSTSKYTKWYKSIVDRRFIDPASSNYEIHHVVPKCMGGVDDKDNLVQVTIREHFVLHLLLPKMVSGKHKYQLTKAVKFMAISRNITSRVVEKMKLDAKWRKDGIERMRQSKQGKVWYHNSLTGISKQFADIPSADWVKGRGNHNWGGFVQSSHQRKRAKETFQKHIKVVWLDGRIEQFDCIKDFLQQAPFTGSQLDYRRKTNALHKLNIHEVIIG